MQLRVKIVKKRSRNKDGTWSKCWQSGETTIIRIPILFKEQILAYAKMLDSQSQEAQEQQ